MVEIEKYKIDIKNEDERIIAGWATVETKDLDGDIVPISEMIKAMMDYMDRGGLIMYGHSNKPVGKVVYWDVKKHPETGEYGVFIIAKLNKGYRLEDDLWKAIKEGRIRGFSIGGHGKRVPAIIKSDNGKEEPVRIVKNLELYEISLVEKPANPYATIVEYSFAKSDNFKTLIKGYDIDYEKYVEELEKVENSEFYNMLKEKFADVVAYEFYGKKFDELDEKEKYMVLKFFDAMSKIIALTNMMFEDDENEEENEKIEVVEIEEGCNDKKDEEAEETKKFAPPTEIKNADQIIQEAQDVYEKEKGILPKEEQKYKETGKTDIRYKIKVLDTLFDELEAELNGLKKSLEQIRKGNDNVYLGRRVKDTRKPGLDSVAEVERICQAIINDYKNNRISYRKAMSRLNLLSLVVTRSKEFTGDKEKKALDTIDSYREKLKSMREKDTNKSYSLKSIENVLDAIDELEEDFFKKMIKDEFDLDEIDDENLRNWIIQSILAYVYDGDNEEWEVDDGVSFPHQRVRDWGRAYCELGGFPRIFRQIAEKILAGQELSDNEKKLLEMLIEYVDSNKDIGALTTQSLGVFNQRYGKKPIVALNKVDSSDKARFVDEAKKILERYVETTTQKSKIPALVEYLWTNYAETRRINGQEAIKRISEVLGIPVNNSAKAFREIKEMIEEIEEEEETNKRLSNIYSILKEIEEILKPNDLRPPKEWFDRCVERTGSERLCAWIYWHWLKPTSSKDDDQTTREARQRKRKWLNQRVKNE